MCYSAQIESKWKRHVRDMEARMAWAEFRELAQLRLADPGKYRLPRGFDLEFANPETDEERAIKDLIGQFRPPRYRSWKRRSSPRKRAWRTPKASASRAQRYSRPWANSPS